MSVADACKFMGEKHIGSVLLSRKGIIHAIFTERDLISRALTEKKNLNSATVGSFASSPLITVEPTTDVKEAARIMADMRVRRLVVVKDGRPIGLFTAADLEGPWADTLWICSDRLGKAWRWHERRRLQASSVLNVGRSFCPAMRSEDGRSVASAERQSASTALDTSGQR